MESTSNDKSSVLAGEVYSANESKNFHILELVKEEADVVILSHIAREQLRIHKIDVGQIPKKRDSRSKARRDDLSTPGSAISSTPNHDENAISRFIQVKLKNRRNVRVTIPKVLYAMVTYIQRYIDDEGIFRKSGASSRINRLMKTMDETDSEIRNTNLSVYDVCEALKYHIRSMKEPLIPYYLHATFLRCVNSLEAEKKNEAIVLAVLLLPKPNLEILLYLIEFFHKITEHSSKNKMDSRNLAIVFAPNIMPFTGIPTKLGKDSTPAANELVINKHVEVVKILIELGTAVGILSTAVGNGLMAAMTLRSSEDELENDGEPRKRKLRSASLNRVFDFLRRKKAMRSDTPVNSNDSNLTTPNSVTPIISSHSRKRACEPIVMPVSSSTKNRILSAIQKKGLIFPVATPVASAVGFLSPGICLNPRSDVTGEPRYGKPKLRLHRSERRGVLTNREVKRQKSVLPILPLTSSPRSSNCTTPSSYDTLDSTLTMTESEPGTNDEVTKSMDEELWTGGSCETQIRITPVVNEIHILTLAAMADTPAENITNAKNFTKTSTKLKEVPLEFTGDTTDGGGNVHRRMTRSKLRIEARRCQSFNRPKRTNSRQILRTRSDGSTLTKSSGFQSSLSPPLVKATSQCVRSQAKASGMSRSPNQCTLKRGRPNTLRVGLPRPSPASQNIISTHKPKTAHSTVASSNITFDRKGRVSRKINYLRPPLTLPTINSPEILDVLRKTTRPVRNLTANFAYKVDIRKVSTEAKPENNHISNSMIPSGSAGLQLSKEVDGSVKGVKPSTANPLTPGRKLRSNSVRSDMIRPSPVKPNPQNKHPSFKGDECGGRAMRRGVSVQELVKKFDGYNTEFAPSKFYTLRTRIQPSANSKQQVVSCDSNSGKSIFPPLKPPRKWNVSDANSNVAAKSLTSTQPASQQSTTTLSKRRIQRKTSK